MENQTDITPENRKKIVKKISKIAVIVVSMLVVFLLLLSIVAFAFEDKITDIFLHRIYQYTFNLTGVFILALGPNICFSLPSGMS